MKNKKQMGITLVALVVTIVVLLILAGVSLNLVLGNNGIITKARDSKEMSRAGRVEDEVALWKTDNYLARNAGGTTTSADDMLQGLKDKHLIEEDEIDRDNEMIKITKKDGTIVKEISYSDGNVTINISKSPETEKTARVKLQVTSVEGVPTIRLDDIPSMDEETKKELIRQTEVINLNANKGTNVSTLEEVIRWKYEQGWISYNTEEAFWNDIEANEGIDDFLVWKIEDLFPNDSATDTYYICEIRNPDNEMAYDYIAEENGTYTFTIKDISSGQIYAQSVDVTNIDKSIPYYVDDWSDRIVLVEKATDNATTFEKAFIIYNNEKIEITDIISEEGTYNCFYSEQVGRYFDNEDEWNAILNTYQTFILVKDGIEYIGPAFIMQRMPQ